MKYLLLVTLFLFGCSYEPRNVGKFKVGDCVINGRFEIIKITQIGEYGYKGITKIDYSSYYKDVVIHTNYGTVEKTDCFDLFDNVKETK
jgi:hypothetical protein